MVIELLGLMYGMAKDVISYLKYTENEKIIDYKRAEQLKKSHMDKGENIRFRFSKPDKIEGRKQDGWDYYYEIDVNKKTKSILKLKDGQILIAKYD